MYQLPPPPPLPLSQRASGRLTLRYEDVAQDGRLQPTAMPAALAQVFWQRAAVRDGLRAQLDGSGVMPILARLCCEVGPGPIAADHPLTAHCRYDLAHQRDGAEVVRLLLRIWLDLRGPRAPARGTPPAGAGEVVAAGALYAEHVFTRPFAAAGQRRVTQLPAGRWPPVPTERAEWLAAPALRQPGLQEVAQGAWTCDAAPVVFGLGDTDANRHVNSLVYLRVCYAAALRALVRHGSPAPLTLQYQELRFRKPCFAGDVMQVKLCCYRVGCGWAVRAMLLPLDAPSDGRAHVYALMTFATDGA